MSGLDIFLVIFMGLFFIGIIVMITLVIRAYKKERFFFLDDKKVEVKTTMFHGTKLIIDGIVVDEQSGASSNVYANTNLIYQEDGMQLKVNIGSHVIGLKVNAFLNNQKLPLQELKGEKISVKDYLNNNDANNLNIFNLNDNASK